MTVALKVAWLAIGFVLGFFFAITRARQHLKPQWQREAREALEREQEAS